MSKNKIIWDSPEPSSEDIQSKKDFEGLQRRFNGSGSVKSFRNWTIGAVAAAILAVGTLVYFYDGEEKTNENISELIEIEEFDQTSIPDILPEVPAETFSFDSNEATHIISKEGSIISIPENAFTTGDGKAYSGAVNLKLTTFNDPLDIYLSGISMAYDSIGVEYPFQSAGMFEVLADNGSETLILDDGKELTIYHPSTIEEDEMNDYYMSDRTGEWEYEGKSEKTTFKEACENETITFNRDETPEFAEINEKSNELSLLINEKNKADLEEIVEPHEFNDLNYTFDLDINPVEFPELSSFTNVQFEVVDKSFRHHFFDRVWDDIKLKKSKDGSYQVDLYEESDITSIKVFPILDEKEQERAMAEYQERLEEKENNLEKLDQEIYSLEEFLADKKKHQAQNTEVFSRNNLISALESVMNEGRTMRRFTIGRLGIFNCDKPYEPGANALNVDANFLVKKRALQVFAITIVNVSRNVYMQIMEKDFSKIRLRKRDQHIAYGKNRDGKLVILRKEDFKDLNKDRIQYDFDMTLVDADYNDYNAIKKEVGLLMGG